MNESDRDFLEKLSTEIETELTDGILPFWIENAVDFKKGGFFGRITFDNIPIKDAEKGSILTARILWAFSAVYKKYGDAAYKKMADHAYQYLTETLWDHTHNGVYWMVDVDGNPTDSRKHVYAQAFTIYALTEYYSAVGVEAALRQAKKLYLQIEAKCTDQENGGYFEAYSREWELLEDVRLSEKDRNEPKSMNTHLHLLEAYTNLYRYWKSPELNERLVSLLDIFDEHIINPEKTSLITFLGEDWTPKSDEISFGHDIETSWLLLEAAEVLGDYPGFSALSETCLHITDHVLKEGMDDNGGIFNEAGPKGIVDDNKDWWPQAEAAVGFLNAYELTGNTEYLNATSKVWEFIKEHMIDKTHGEWHEKVTRSGVPYRLDKVRAWKCPYHNGRTALEVIRRTERLLNSAPVQP